MDTKEYILSGVIEAYVLGLASDEEAREVQGYAMQYADVRQAITDFEVGLENQALQAAIQPPAFLKEKILAALKNEANKNNKQTLTVANNVTQQASSAKVVSIASAPKSVRWLRGAVAASIILLLGSAILNFYYYSQYKKSTKQYSDLLASQNTLMARIDAYRTNITVLTDTAMIKVTMKAASAERDGSIATIFWNKKLKNVLLTVNNLPVPAAGKQYQLWAIVNGQPVDAGLVNNTTIGNEAATTPMKKINDAQAFAITLENEGGSPSPHLEQLYVLGKI